MFAANMSATMCLANLTSQSMAPTSSELQPVDLLWVELLSTVFGVIGILLLWAELERHQHSAGGHKVCMEDTTQVNDTLRQRAQIEDDYGRSAHAEKGDIRQASHAPDELKPIGQDGTLEDMLPSIEEVPNRSWSCPDPMDCHRFIVRLAKGGDPVTAHTWLQRSVQDGIDLQPGSFIAVIRSYLETGAIAQARQVADEMKSAGLDINIESWLHDEDIEKPRNEPIEHNEHVNCEHEEVETVPRRTREQTKASGMASALEPAKFRRGMSQHAPSGKQQEMKMSDFSKIIRASCGARNPAKAGLYLRRCWAAGYFPSPELCNIVIRAYIKSNAFAEAEELANDIMDAGLDINTYTYSMLMDVSRRVGHDSAVPALMKRMLAQGLQPNHVNFSIVFETCAAARLPDDLYEWFRMSRELGVKLDYEAFASVAYLLVRARDLLTALNWLKIMNEEGMQPQMRCFMGVLRLILDKGDVRLAGILIDQMHLAKVRPDGGVFSPCIVLAVQSGHGSTAKRWANDCLSCNGVLNHAAKRALFQAGFTVTQSGEVY